MRKILKWILCVAILGIPGWALCYFAGGEPALYGWVVSNQPMGWAGMFLLALASFSSLAFYGGLEPELDPLKELYQMEERE